LRLRRCLYKGRRRGRREKEEKEEEEEEETEKEVEKEVEEEKEKEEGQGIRQRPQEVEESERDPRLTALKCEFTKITKYYNIL